MGRCGRWSDDPSRRNTGAGTAGGLYNAINNGRVDIERPRTALAGLPLPTAADGRLVLAVDVSPWLRPDGNICPDQAFCHTDGCGKSG